MSLETVTVVVLPIAAYLIGAIPFGLLIGRLRGVDIRKHGSGNIGATNVGRVLGMKWGLLAFGLDVLKGMVPVGAASWIVHRSEAVARLTPPAQTVLMLTVAAGCILGHIWPIWLRFKGGKGVATSLGAVLGYWPFLTLPGIGALATWVTVVVLTRYVSVASITAGVAFPIYLTMLGVWQKWDRSQLLLLLVFSTVMAGLVVVRHRGNIARLRAGTEPKIGQGHHVDAPNSAEAA